MVGVYAPGGDASRMAFFSLYALQHRGQESAGIAAADGHSIRVHRDMGLVSQVFREEELSPLSGSLAIGHTRYSTTGSSEACNAQPFLVRGVHGELALGHNGNVVNALELQRQLVEQWGCTFSSTTDSEVIAYLLANAPGRTWEERIGHCMRSLQGAFSAVALTRDTLMAIRDPLGVRPLCIGKLNGGWVIASESCALDHLGAEFLRELEPGESVLIGPKGLRSYIWPGAEGRRAACVFELIYFARPDSVLNGKLVYTTRRALGAQLAREHPAEADVVIGIPDSATAAAVGYAQESGMPYSEGLVKNRYVARTFIEPDQRLRGPWSYPEVQSPHRGHQRQAGGCGGRQHRARHHHPPRGGTASQGGGPGGAPAGLCPAHPPPLPPWGGHGHPPGAYRGQQERGRDKAVHRHDSLGYLSVKGLLKTVGGTRGGFCDACFTGNYPIPVQLEMDKLVLEHPQEVS